MKFFYPALVLCVLALGILSCSDKVEVSEYRTRFHVYGWNADSIPLSIPSSGIDRIFKIKDKDGILGGIVGVDACYGINGQDTVKIFNTGLINYKNSILSDTLCTDWFTIITENERQLKIQINKNEGTQTRYLELSVWPYNLGDFYGEMAAVSHLVIFQEPSNNK